MAWNYVMSHGLELCITQLTFEVREGIFVCGIICYLPSYLGFQRNPKLNLVHLRQDNVVAHAYEGTPIDRAKFSWRREQSCVHISLRRAKSIIIIRSDKGVAVAIVVYVVYVNKMITVLENVEKFVKLGHDRTNAFELKSS